MITLVFLALVVLSAAVAFMDWRRGILLMILCGVVQDPVRKLTSGTPVILTMTVVAVYAAILLAAAPLVRDGMGEMKERFARLRTPVAIVGFFLILAALNGLITFGLEQWKVPMLSLFVYLVPIPAVILGYAYVRKEEDIFRLFRYYGAITSIALIGTVLEYVRVPWRALGVVAFEGDYIRHLPGIQIRVLSGFYRGPDIMGWHAATLAIIGITMGLRERVLSRALPWIAVAGWGFVNCMISGRRKAIYMVAVFVLAFVWRYAKRLNAVQIVSLVLAGIVMIGIVQKIASNETSNVYAKGAATSRSEVLQRLEGGTLETIRQYGILGAGLGTATQGAHHLARGRTLGWQEGGLAKLTVELGVPGLLATFALAFALFRLLAAITMHPDLPETSQFLRAALFGMVVANAANFAASAQAYTDPLLTLMVAFFLGMLLSTAALDERVAIERVRRGGLSPATA